MNVNLFKSMPGWARVDYYNDYFFHRAVNEYAVVQNLPEVEALWKLCEVLQQERQRLLSAQIELTRQNSPALIVASKNEH